MTAAQRVMATALLYPEPAKLKRVSFAAKDQEIPTGSLSKARAVLRYSETLADAVMPARAGALGFRAKGERAISLAILYPDGGKPAPGRKDPAATAAETASVSMRRIQEARQVLRYSQDLGAAARLVARARRTYAVRRPRNHRFRALTWPRSRRSACARPGSSSTATRAPIGSACSSRSCRSSPLCRPRPCRRSASCRSAASASIRPSRRIAGRVSLPRAIQLPTAPGFTPQRRAYSDLVRSRALTRSDLTHTRDSLRQIKPSRLLEIHRARPC